MDKVRVVICEGNVAQRDLLSAALRDQADIDVVYATGNGLDAWLAIERLHPQVVVCDMVMPQLDGFGLLERIGGMEANARPAMIALTALGRDDFINRAVQLGISDYLVKPADPALLAERIRQLGERTGNDEVPTEPAAAQPTQWQTLSAADEGFHHLHSRLPAQVVVHNRERSSRMKDAVPSAKDETREKYAAMLLMQLGMPAHLDGYQYLLYAVMMTAQAPNIIKHMMQDVYPAIAQHYHTTPSRVERSIRHAVSVTWERGGGTAFNRLMNHNAPEAAPKPSNSELIAQLAARIRFTDGHRT